MNARDRDAGLVRVVYGEGNPTERDRSTSTLSSSESVVVEAVATVEAVVDSIDDGDDSVDCVVSGRSLSDGTWRDLVRAVRERDPDLPIVLYPPEADAREASEATAAGVTSYLPRPFDDDGEELLARVLASAEAYDRHRRHRHESTMFRSLQETVPVSIFFKDTEGRFLAVPSSVEESVGAEMIGKTDPEIWGDTFGETAREAYEDDMQVIETGEPILEKEERHVEDGESLWMRTTKLPWRDESGEIRGLIGITMNVTDLKLRELELERQSRRFEQFASFASHDLRNPVAVAKGYLQQARETDEEALFDEVAWALDRMDDLIGDLLTMVRRDDTERTRTWIELTDLVERIWMAVGTDESTLHVDVPAGTRIRSVEGQLQQLLGNVFRNAIDHAGPDVEVTVGLTDDGFFVADDGPGIDDEDPNAVFEYGHTDGGTGVGLTIVKEITDAHGWDVSAHQSDDGGARFEFGGCLLLPPEFHTAIEGPPIALTEETAIGDETLPWESRRDERGVWTVRSGGVDVWEDVDEHFFAYARVDGPVRIVAKVVELEPVDEYSKAGVMVRDDAVAGTPLVYTGLTPSHGSEVIDRRSRANVISTKQFEEHHGTPHWHRLDRFDSTVICSVSSDGEDWTVLDRKPIECADPVAIGLAVCSHDPANQCTAVFEDVRVVPLQADDA